MYREESQTPKAQYHGGAPTNIELYVSLLSPIRLNMIVIKESCIAWAFSKAKSSFPIYDFDPSDVN